MLAWLKLGFRNLVKNGRRSLITTLAIALGFAAVNVFRGFAEYLHMSNEQVAIYVTAQGHLMFFKRGFLEQGRLDPAGYLFNAEELRAIEAICKGYDEIEFCTPQLRITGLLTNGTTSTIFIADGIVPSAYRTFLERLQALLMPKIGSRRDAIRGKLMEDDQEHGVAISFGLAELLELDIGSSAVAFTNTVDGQMNAMDVEVFQLFTAFSALNDKSMRVPFSFAQKLYDTDGADRVAVLLTRTDATEAVRDRLRADFEKQGLEVDIKTWVEMSEWYRSVKEMFDTIFRFVFVIVFVIVVMSVVNTMSMAVLERTREIGTLRALGLKRRGVLRLFAAESLLLGAIGSIAGVCLTLAAWALVNWLQPTWVPPGVPRQIIIRVELVFETMVYSFLVLQALCLAASLIAARRAARQNIVDALGHV
jgi:putative ABC transport system permease protein